jgi:hypothetical protein
MTQKALKRVPFLVRKNRLHVRLQYKKDLQSNHFPTKQYNFYKEYSTRRVFVGCLFFLSKGVLSFGGFCTLFTVGTQMFTASSDWTPFVEQFPQKERMLRYYHFWD